jgi:hypothetical protein
MMNGTHDNSPAKYLDKRSTWPARTRDAGVLATMHFD